MGKKFKFIPETLKLEIHFLLLAVNNSLTSIEEMIDCMKDNDDQIDISKKLAHAKCVLCIARDVLDSLSDEDKELDKEHDALTVHYRWLTSYFKDSRMTKELAKDMPKKEVKKGKKK